MIDAPVDELNLRIRVEASQKVTKLLAGDFEDILGVACFLVEHDVPESIRTVPRLRRMIA